MSDLYQTPDIFAYLDMDNDVNGKQRKKGGKKSKNRSRSTDRDANGTVEGREVRGEQPEAVEFQGEHSERYEDIDELKSWTNTSRQFKPGNRF